MGLHKTKGLLVYFEFLLPEFGLIFCGGVVWGGMFRILQGKDAVEVS